MSIDVGAAIERGLDELTSNKGAQIFAVFLGFKLVDMLVWQIATGAFVGILLTTLSPVVARALGFDVAASEISVERLQTELVERGYFMVASWLEGLTGAGPELPVGLTVTFALAVLVIVVLALVGELLHVLAIRAIAIRSEEPLPDAATQDLGSTYLRSLAANVLAMVLIAVCLVLFVIPGLVLAVMFVFVRHRVVLSGDGVTEALSNSFGLVRRNLAPVLILGFILGVVYWLTTNVVAALPLPDWTQRIATTAWVVYSLVVVTVAYLQTDAPVDLDRNPQPSGDVDDAWTF